MSTLARIDPELHQLLVEQRGLYDSALLKGSDAEAREQSEAMVRGWRAACQRLEQPLQEDDSYFVGFDTATGTKVVIGEHKGCMARAQTLHGGRVIYMTPDEVAKLLGGVSVLQQVKSAFPDAEILNFEDMEQ